jgi:2-C-methyl-D-erythritol 4-phosphate cytidylyltransferase
MGELKKYAIILAAGKGSRMESEVAKQFLILHDKPVLCYSIDSFLNAREEIELIIVFPPDLLHTGKSVLKQYYPEKEFTVTTGGETRFHSVAQGLKEVPSGEDSIILVHDAARCLLSSGLIRNCLQEAAIHGSAVPMVACSDSVRWQDESGNKPLDRSHVFLVQTPQAFKSSILISAFQAGYDPSFTDEATVVEKSGCSIHAIEGEAGNFKITRPLDLKLAELLITSEGQMKRLV